MRDQSFSEIYTSVSLAEAGKIELSDDAYAICESMEILANAFIRSLGK